MRLVCMPLKTFVTWNYAFFCLRRGHHLCERFGLGLATNQRHLDAATSGNQCLTTGGEPTSGLDHKTYSTARPEENRGIQGLKTTLS